jgi:hypothetical protein
MTHTLLSDGKGGGVGYVHQHTVLQAQQENQKQTGINYSDTQAERGLEKKMLKVTNSTMSEDAAGLPRTVATLALSVRRPNH